MNASRVLIDVAWRSSGTRASAVCTASRDSIGEWALGRSRQDMIWKKDRAECRGICAGLDCGERDETRPAHLRTRRARRQRVTTPRSTDAFGAGPGIGKFRQSPAHSLVPRFRRTLIEIGWVRD